MTAADIEQIVFTNEFKIRFCNVMNALEDHIKENDCHFCNLYLLNGDGDLCEQGKEAIKKRCCYNEK